MFGWVSFCRELSGNSCYYNEIFCYATGTFRCNTCQNLITAWLVIIFKFLIIPRVHNTKHTRRKIILRCSDCALAATAATFSWHYQFYDLFVIRAVAGIRTKNCRANFSSPETRYFLIKEQNSIFLANTSTVTVKPLLLTWICRDNEEEKKVCYHNCFFTLL